MHPLYYCFITSCTFLISTSCFSYDFYNIEQLIPLAISSHPTVLASQAEQQMTALQIKAAQTQRYPTVSVQSQWNEQNKLSHQLNVRQPLWTGGKITASIAETEYHDYANQYAVIEQQRQIAQKTIDAWQSYVEAESLIWVYGKILKDLEQFKLMMQRRVTQGVSAKIELDLIDNRILLTRTQYQSATEQQRIALLRLQQLIGDQQALKLSHNSTFPIQYIQELLERAKADLIHIEQVVLKQSAQYIPYHPIITKAEYQIKAAEQAVKISQADKYPTIYTQYTYQYQPNSIDKHDHLWSVGVNFTGDFTKYWQTKLKYNEVNRLYAVKEASQRQIEETLQTQYQQLQHNYQQMKILKIAVNGATLVSDSYQRQFVVGRKSWLEVLNAVRESMDNQAQLMRANSLFLANYYKLNVDLKMMNWQSRNQEVPN